MLLASRVVALLVLTLAVCLSACSPDRTEPTVRPALVTQASAGAAAFDAFAGEVHAREEPSLAFRIGGKITRRLVDAGEQVRAGQPLAELDATDVRLQSDASAAQLASAQSDLVLARAELTRTRISLIASW